MSVLDLEHLPREQVLDTLGRSAKEVLVDGRHADGIVLGCAGMAGLERHVEAACRGKVRVFDPVKCAVETCKTLIRLHGKHDSA